MMRGKTASLAFVLLSTAAMAQAPDPVLDNAARFGARPSVEHVSLSPDGSQIAYVVPIPGQGAVLTIAPADGQSRGTGVMRATGKPDRLQECNWVASKRLVCQIYGVTQSAVGLLPFSRLVALDTDGNNLKLLKTETNEYSRGLQLTDGEIIDWLPDEDGVVLMARTHLPDDHVGSRLGSDKEGFGVDRIDTRTTRATAIEQPRPRITDYITDGRGTVRVRGIAGVEGATEQLSGITTYHYRRLGSQAWEKLSDYNGVTGDGFKPLAVDHDRNIVFGLQPLNGRDALYSIALDGTLTSTLVFAHPQVDVQGLQRIGRRNRVVGATYLTDKSEVFYFDPEMKALTASLSRAIPKQPIVQIVDSSVDERKLLIFAGSDEDPGLYYLFDRDAKELRILMPARADLEGAKLATMKHVGYRAADGTMIPAYLTLPPGKESAKGLPGIVLPHGGPSARDDWGFDWLPQFYAAQGYAVLQPQFRGSAGYGEAWYNTNGYRRWRVAVGDVVDAGRWLASEGIADPAKLAIVGWSYGGYAALQTEVLAPGLFKAIVAIAPVTDLTLLQQQYTNWNNQALIRDFVGSGADIIRAGSPAQNAGAIKAPVLLVHGTMDRNVFHSHSTLMESRIKSSGGKVQLISFDGLDHYLHDSGARARMLRESDAFIRAAIGG